MHIFSLKNLWKVASATFLVFLIILTFDFIKKEPVKANDSGYITVIVNNINNEIVDKKRIEFDESDTLFDLLDREFNLIYENSTYGHYLTGINDIKTDGYNTFIWLEIAYLKENKEFNEVIKFSDYNLIDSPTGVDLIELEDNMIIGINERNLNTYSSINRDEINLSDELNYTSNKTKSYFGIITIIITAITIITLVVLSIKKKDNLTIREITLMSLLAIILIIQEEILSFIPNIQLTFLLICLYTKCLGLRKSIYIIFIHVLLDNLIMGSFNIIVMLPMFIGYVILAILANLVRNKKHIYMVLISIIGSLIYCYMFLIFNAFLLDINVLDYFLLDIPFEILLVLSSILTISYLFKPLEKRLNILINNLFDK